MSRPAQIRFLSRVARLYNPVVRLLGFRRLWRRVAAAAAPATGERALDVCTGTGGLAGALALDGARVVGVDLAPGMLARARERAPERALSLVRMDARALAFSDCSFPLVTCCMALHEMAEEERAQVLRELERVASDRVVLADYRVPATRVGRALFRLLRGFEYLESDAFEPFVARDFRARLEGAGLALRSVRDAGGYRIWLCAPRARLTPDG